MGFELDPGWLFNLVLMFIARLIQARNTLAAPFNALNVLSDPARASVIKPSAIAANRGYWFVWGGWYLFP